MCQKEITKKEQSKMIKLNLNKIEGFFPESELMEISVTNEYGDVVDKRYYLPLNVKQTWFWLKYPEGAIKTKVKNLSESHIVAECRLYRNYKDNPEEYFVSAEKYLSINYSNPFYVGRTKEEIIGGHVNAAKAGAESIALYKGGFGIQLESPEESDLISDKMYENSILNIPLPKIKEADTGKSKQEKDLEQHLERNKGSQPFIPFEPIANDNQCHTVSAFAEQGNGLMTLVRARSVITSSENPRFKGKSLGKIFDESPLAIPYIAVKTDGEEKEAAILLSNTTKETKAKLEQYLSR